MTAPAPSPRSSRPNRKGGTTIAVRINRGAKRRIGEPPAPLQNAREPKTEKPARRRPAQSLPDADFTAQQERKRSLLWIGVSVSMLIIIGIWLSLVRFSFDRSGDKASLFTIVRNRLSSVFTVQSPEKNEEAELQALQEKVFPPLPKSQ